MSEETRESYDSGEVVWVKLGSSWWPGEVKNSEELPSDMLDFKKPPLAIVKFFDEDSYEYVKTWTNIYPYNCEKKNEFIKKGMAAFRAKTPHMEKFPKDVLKAEEKLGGNPNILSDPMFLPKQKRTYSQGFGTPSPKASGNKNKRRSNSNKSKKDTSHITHRRFLGVDDYKAYICIQYPGKDRIPGDKEDEEVIRINREPDQEFNCHSCSFSTKRLEVMILHTKLHIQGLYLSSSRRTKQATTSKRRKEKSKKPQNSDANESESSDSDSEPVKSKKRKSKTQGVKTPKVKKAEPEKEPPKKDIRSELLEAWEDSEDEDLDISIDKINDTTDNSIKIIEDTSVAAPDLTKDGLTKKSDASDTLNSSDAIDQNNSVQIETADEDLKRLELEKPLMDEVKSPSQTIEEVLNDVSGQLDESNGQEKQSKPVEEPLSTEKLLSTLEDDSMDGDDKNSKDGNEKTVDEAAAQELSDVDDITKKKMDKDMHEAIKSCFDFNEDDEEDTRIVGKATSGRKIPRVIPKVARKKSSGGDIKGDKKHHVKESKVSKDKERGNRNLDIDTAFKELMEMTAVPDLPDVQNTLKCEQNFHNIKTIKFPDKTEKLGSPPKPEKKDSTETVTKLINPKKRFVKSFEDFELMQNEIRRKEEERLGTTHERYDLDEPKTIPSSSASACDYWDNSEEQDSPANTIELSKLKSKIMSKIIEEAKAYAESKSKASKPKTSEKGAESKTTELKLKPKSTESKETKIPEAYTKTIESDIHKSGEELKSQKVGSHRTPRSKILESYRKDTNKHKIEEKTDTPLVEELKNDVSPTITEETAQDRLKDNETDKSIVPPKKSKWSRRGSHPKKDRKLFLLQDAPPDVPASTNDTLPDVPASTKDTVPDVPASTKDTFPDVSASTNDTLPDVPASIKDTVPDVPASTKDTFPDVSASTKDTLPDVPASTKEILPVFPASTENTLPDVPARTNDSPPDVPASTTDTLPDVPACTKEVPEKLIEEPKKDDWINSESNLVDDMSKANDSFIDESKLMSSSDVSTHEVLEEEELDTTERKVESPEPQSTEPVPLQIDENCSSIVSTELPEETPVINEEIKAKESLISTEKEEILQEKEFGMDIDNSNDISKSEQSIELEKDNHSFTEVPVEVFPEVKEEKPLEEAKETLEIDEKMHEKPEDSPKQSNECETFEKATLDNLQSKEGLSDSTEDFSAEVKNILSPAPHGDTSVLPMNESQTPDKDKFERKMVEITEEEIVEQYTAVSPVADSYESLENPSATLPKDVITPLKKNKKRKFIEGDFAPTSIQSELELQPEHFTPLEKKKKDIHVEEEEMKVSSPLLDTFESSVTDKSDTIPLKSEETAVVSETNTSINKEIESQQPICVTTGEEIEDKSLNDNLVVDSGKEEDKLITEQATVNREDDKVENDMKSLDPEIGSEKAKDIDQNKELLDAQSLDTQIVSEKPKDVDKDKELLDMKSLDPQIGSEKAKDIDENTELLDPSVNEHNNEVEIQCASSSVDSFKFSIQTNLSILSSREEMSALALATLSEIKADLENNEDIISKEDTTPKHTVLPPLLLESEMVPIEGNLTVVSEKDLADGQVEITTEQVISPKKPITLSNFSLDFSDSFSDSNSNSTTDITDLGKTDFNSKGTEFTSKALTKQMKKLDHKKENAYGRLELLNILEGNSDTEKKQERMRPPKKTSLEDDICDFEEHIPSQIVCAKSLKKDVPMEPEPELIERKGRERGSKTSIKSTTSKLLERLTTESKVKTSAAKSSTANNSEVIGKLAIKNPSTVTPTPKNTRYILKSKPGISITKPIILSEPLIKPTTDPHKLKLRKSLEDIEDVETFVIHKDANKLNFEEDESAKLKSVSPKTSGKAKILQQTIITPAGEILQPTVTEPQLVDDNIFDINSMPIVLSDEILTPESIEKMPIMIGGDTKTTIAEKVIKRATPGRIITTVATQPIPNKTITLTKHKPPRILQTGANKVTKNSPLLPSTAKPGKYIIVPQSSIPPTKYVPKKPPAVKKTALPTGIVQKVPNIAPEPSGNKIMIVTNQQGQQQRLLLTPAQQKLLGYQSPKLTKTVVKGNVIQKSVLATKSVSLTEAGTSGIISKTSSIIGQKVVLGANVSQGLMTTSHIGTQGRSVKASTRRSPAGAQKLVANTGKLQKTILIKNQHGQTVRTIQGTDDDLLDKQVAEQLEAIKASSGMKFSSQQKAIETLKTTPKPPARRSYTKRGEVKPRGSLQLTSIHQSPKPETIVSMPTVPVPKKSDPVEPKPVPPLITEEPKIQPPERPLNQLVIQDAVGNQTTITEGQIFALPSETVDGQPQSYMLVTLDESGNLTPLNNEALMSLDPNLGLGGDLSNMVLQIDQGSGPQPAVIKPPEITEPAKMVEVETTLEQVVPAPEPSVSTEIADVAVTEQKIVPATETQSIVPSTNGDSGQQLIVTGDPIATQKFLESLTEGTTDLANILANAEGNSILIQAEGQQILINTNTDNQMLLTMNNDNVNTTENTEGAGNPIFAVQPSKSQDILAAALADTDVFQQEHPSSTQSKISSQLSPSNTLYPMNVGNVLETSLTLSSPIMTPLEIPSSNKKIPDDEADILTQVPKNVDLPITITDPNISQTVANQQVSAMMANDLQTNLELALPISESTISAVSAGMNSPSFVYSLPALEDSVEMTQKPFNGSMPLLNEDVEEAANKTKIEDDHKSNNVSESSNSKSEISSERYLVEDEGRFTLGGEMCSSLSEPPPEMFDLPEVNQNFMEKSTTTTIPSLQSTPDMSDTASKDEDTTDLSTQADTSSEGSCEIPLQPQIVAKSLDLSENLESLKQDLGETEAENEKCKFD